MEDLCTLMALYHSLFCLCSQGCSFFVLKLHICHPSKEQGFGVIKNRTTTTLLRIHSIYDTNSKLLISKQISR